MDQMKGYRIAAKYEKHQLLFAINCVAALSIFFFVRELTFPKPISLC